MCQIRAATPALHLLDQAHCPDLAWSSAQGYVIWPWGLEIWQQGSGSSSWIWPGGWSCYKQMLHWWPWLSWSPLDKCHKKLSLKPHFNLIGNKTIKQCSTYKTHGEIFLLLWNMGASVIEYNPFLPHCRFSDSLSAVPYQMLLICVISYSFYIVSHFS